MGVSVAAQKITVDGCFLRMACCKRAAKSTVITYSNSYRNYAPPTIGSSPACQIRYPKLQTLLSPVSDRVVGSVTSARKILSASGKLAIKSGYIESQQTYLVEVASKDYKRRRPKGTIYIRVNQPPEAVTDTRIAFLMETEQSLCCLVSVPDFGSMSAAGCSALNQISRSGRSLFTISCSPDLEWFQYF